MAVRSNSSSFSYDVFLSFRGEDTRLGFTGNLYKTLTDKGIHTFIDDEELRRGDEITLSLVKAIQDSRIAIIVLSKDYVSSSFCLDELATIIDCKSKGMLVIPVFYKIDPSDVRHHNGSYGEALAKHEMRFHHNPEKLQKWKMALRQVADFSGYHFKDGDEYEYKFIARIVASINKINPPAPLYVADYPVGLDSQVPKVMKLLDVGSDDGVHMVGIYGMGGIGKSTLARAVYNNLIAENFDGFCYLENVKEESNKHGLKHLQNILLQEILRDMTIDVASVPEGASEIPRRLQQKKVLLVLDDVDKDEQLKVIIGRLNWFGLGSRIIITTRDKQLLASHEVQNTYEVNELDENCALQLLTWKAFKKEKVDPNYSEVLNCVVAYASGLPLALEVIGSHLFGKSIEEWKSAIKQYKRIPHRRIQDILKVSFDALQDEEKSIFLDIACCLKGYQMTEVEVILHALYDDNMKCHIGVLLEKSLIKVNQDGTIKLHDLILDMCRQIDQKQSPKEPGKRKRLWLPKHIFEVLEDNTGTREIEIIYLDVPIYDNEETIEWEGKAFKKMKNLKILIIKNGKFSEGPKCLPNSLRVLEWWGYPSHCLPSDFDPKNLAICKLPVGCFTSFELDGLSEKLVNLKYLNFDGCQYLKQIPYVSGLRNLEKLSFEYCENLIAVDYSVGYLDKLKRLSAEGCYELGSFPPIKLTSLEHLNLSYCWSLENFPEILGKMGNIRNLRLEGTPIKKLPFSFKNLIGLQGLHLDSCQHVELPSSIVMMPELTVISVVSLKGCKWRRQEDGEEIVGSTVSSKVEWLYASSCNLDDDFFSIDFTRFSRVKILDIAYNNFIILPECIKELQYLKSLDVSHCKDLREIRGVPPNLKHFFATECKSLISSSTSMFLIQELHEAQKRLFCLPGDRIPEWFDHRSRGPAISFWFRNNFPHKVVCVLIAAKGSHTNEFEMFINGKVYQCSIDGLNYFSNLKMSHTIVFDLRNLVSRVNLYEMPLKNVWNHVKVTCSSSIEACGIHVFKQKSSMEDVRFIDPSRKRKLEGDLQNSESHNHQLLKKRRFVNMEVSLEQIVYSFMVMSIEVGM